MLLHQNQRLSAVLNSIQQPESLGFNALKPLHAFEASLPQRPRRPGSNPTPLLYFFLPSRTPAISCSGPSPPASPRTLPGSSREARRRRDSRAPGLPRTRPVPPVGSGRRGVRIGLREAAVCPAASARRRGRVRVGARTPPPPYKPGAAS